MKRNREYFTKRILLISSFFWLAAFFFYLAYRLWGGPLIDDAYYERSVSLFNNLVAGRNNHQLEFYYEKADRFVHFTITILVALSFLPLVYALVNLLAKNLTQKTRLVWQLITMTVLVNAIAVLVYVNFPGYRVYFIKEDSLIENLTAAFFFLTFLFGYILLKNRSSRKDFGHIWPMALMILGLIGFLDEISFGERLLALEFPVMSGVKLDAVHDLIELGIVWISGLETVHQILLLLLLISALAIFFIALLKYGKWSWQTLSVTRSHPLHLFMFLFLMCIIFSVLIDTHAFGPTTAGHLQAAEELFELNASVALLFSCLIMSRLPAMNIEGVDDK